MPVAALAIGGIGSIVGGVLSSNAASNAAKGQADAAKGAATLEKQAADEALAFNKLQYGNSLNMISPYVNTGTASLNRLSYLMGLSPQQGLPPGVINPNAPQTAGAGGGAGIDNGGFNPLTFAGRGINPSTGRPIPIPFNSGGTVNRLNASMLQDSPNTAEQATPTFLGPPTTPGDMGGANVNQGGTVTASGSGQVPRTDGGGAPGVPGGDFGSLAQNFGETFQAPTDVTEKNDPGYKFRLQQGQDAIQRSAAARGGLLNTGTAKDLNDYTQNAASGEYGNVYNRAASEFERRYNIFKQGQNDLFNRFATLAGIGQTSAGQLSSAGLSSANNAGNILLTSAGQIGQQYNNAAAARGSGYVGSANALNSIGPNLLNTIGLYDYLNR